MVLLSLATVLVVAVAGASRQPPRPGARVGAAALARRALLRHLSVARADHRADNAGDRPRGPTCSGRRSRWPRRWWSRRCRGATSRSRSATARWASCGLRRARRLAPAVAAPGRARRRSPRRSCCWCWPSLASRRGVKPPSDLELGVGGSLEPPRDRGSRRASRLRRAPGPAGPSTATARRSAAESGSGGAASSTPTAHEKAPAANPPRKRPLRTSCESVVHIGDSTSEGLISSDYLPDPEQRIRAQYARVGVDATSTWRSPARPRSWRHSRAAPNAQKWRRSSSRADTSGCWVIALGTNDTADVYVGSSVGLSSADQAR